MSNKRKTINTNLITATTTKQQQPPPLVYPPTEGETEDTEVIVEPTTATQKRARTTIVATVATVDTGIHHHTNTNNDDDHDAMKTEAIVDSETTTIHNNDNSGVAPSNTEMVPTVATAIPAAVADAGTKEVEDDDDAIQISTTPERTAVEPMTPNNTITKTLNSTTTPTAATPGIATTTGNADATTAANSATTTITDSTTVAPPPPPPPRAVVPSAFPTHSNNIQIPTHLHPSNMDHFDHFLFYLLVVRAQSNNPNLTITKEEYPILYMWIQNLKREYKLYINNNNNNSVTNTAAASSKTNQCRLTAQQIMVLESLHVPLTSRGDDHWNRFYELLVQYKKNHGHVLVPRLCEIPGLGDWVTDQRRQYKAKQQGQPSQMSHVRQDMLDELNFVWHVRNRPEWEVRFAELLDYKAAHGDCRVPQHYKPNKSLGKWVAKQREQYKLKLKGQHSFLTPYREERLNHIGFSWHVRSSLDNEVQGIMDQMNTSEETIATTPTPAAATTTTAAVGDGHDLDIKNSNGVAAVKAEEEEEEETTVQDHGDGTAVNETPMVDVVVGEQQLTSIDATTTTGEDCAAGNNDNNMSSDKMIEV